MENQKAKEPLTQSPVELVIKPNILWAIIEETFTAFIYLSIAVLLIYIPKVILQEDLIQVVVGIITAFGISVNQKVAYSITAEGMLILALIYVFIKVLINTGTTVILESDKVRVIKSLVVKKGEIKKYDDIVRILYKPSILNSGTILLETFEVTKPITVNYVNPLKETFERAREIIRDNMAKEVTQKIQKATTEDMSPQSLEEIMALIKKDRVEKNDLITTINNIARSSQPEDQKNIFKIVLKELTKTRKISRDDLKDTIDELRVTGLISPEDIKDLTELLFTAEESFEGL